jgi:predicted regulator of amino acid metabolism with ACT domain
MHCERRADQCREILVTHVQIARNHGVSRDVIMSLSDVILSLSDVILSLSDVILSLSNVILSLSDVILSLSKDDLFLHFSVCTITLVS